jgi:hypothetical protein
MRSKELLLADKKGRVAVGEAGDGVYGYRKTVRSDGRIILEPIEAGDTPEHWMRPVGDSIRKANRYFKRTPRAIELNEAAAKAEVDSSERLHAAVQTLPSRKQRRLAKFSHAELIEQRQKARASLNPRAFKACKFLSAVLKKGLPIALLGIFGMVFLVGMVGGKLNQGEGALIGFMALGIVASFVLMGLARMILCALFFSRYSLADMLYFLLSLNCMSTLLAVFPSELKFLPALGLIYVAAMPFSYFMAQDPEGDDFIPPFIRQRMMEQRAKARELKKKSEIALSEAETSRSMEAVTAN